MSPRRSSIFSFDTLSQFRRPPRDAWVALLVALGVFCGAELAARAALRPVGRYWEYWSPNAAIKFEWYRRQSERGSPYDIVVVGDSTAANNLDPEGIREGAAGEPEVYNLGWPANFPLAFEESTVPLFDGTACRPALLLVSFNPQGFITTSNVLRFEAGIRSSAICKRIEEGWVMGDIVYLARVRAALPLWKDRLLRGRKWDVPPERLGFIPHRSGDEGLPESAPAGGEGRRPLPLEETRFEALLRLARVARANGIRMAVLVPPRRNKSTIHESLFGEYLARLAAASGELGFHVIDGSAEGFVERGDFSDGVHLNPRGAREFSRRIGALLPKVGRADNAAASATQSATSKTGRHVPPGEGD